MLETFLFWRKQTVETGLLDVMFISHVINITSNNPVSTVCFLQNKNVSNISKQFITSCNNSMVLGHFNHIYTVFIAQCLELEITTELVPNGDHIVIRIIFCC